MNNKRAGFTTVELLVTLFIAVAFVAVFYQLFVTINQTNSEARNRANASSIAYSTLKNYFTTTYPSWFVCNTASDLSVDPQAAGQLISTTNLTEADGVVLPATKTVRAFAPYGCDQNQPVKVEVTIAYDTPQKKVAHSQMIGGSPAAFSCPTGFIKVPGNSLFNTSDFCVMKYEAKNVGGVAVSQASGTSWGTITQPNAAIAASEACPGCHLMTEQEWLTIAHNLVNVASNWSGGAVGSGYIYTGHNDNSPASSLAASTNDSDGYSGTGNTAPSIQRRTLTLSTGEVIWDFAGNVWEWTDSQISGQPGLSSETVYAWKEWNNSSLLLGNLPAWARPSYGTPAAAGWTQANGIGQLHSLYGATTTTGYFRGGGWNSAGPGIFSLTLGTAPTGGSGDRGFRVAR